VKSDIVFERKGLIFTNSQIIAEKSEIQHESVVRLISNNIDDLREFGPIEFSDLKSGKRGRPTRVYYLNERQSTLILTYLDNTEPVKKFKKALVKEFFRMSDFIKSLLATKIEFPVFTDAVMLAHEEPKNYHFSNEINMIYRIVLGMDAKKFREENGIDKGVVIKPYLTLEQIKAIETLQRVDIGLLVVMPDFQQRKATLLRYFNQTRRKQIA